MWLNCYLLLEDYQTFTILFCFMFVSSMHCYVVFMLCFPYVLLFICTFVNFFIYFFSLLTSDRIFIFHPTCRGHMGKRSLPQNDVTGLTLNPYPHDGVTQNNVKVFPGRKFKVVAADFVWQKQICWGCIWCDVMLLLLVWLWLVWAIEII